MSKFVDNDERVKNEMALTARTIEKIVGESAATTTQSIQLQENQ